MTRVLRPILSFKVQSSVPSLPGDPKNGLKWYKFENQNDCILSFTSRKGENDAPKYQV